MTSLLQLALDITDKHKAFKIAKECSPYVDIIEAGTPMIKAYGIKVVRELKRLGLPVAADLKTFDAGSLEAKMACESGADYATVLALASEATIQGFVEVCRSYGVKVVADLMNAPLRRARLLIRLDYIAVHAGIDEQKKGGSPIDSLIKLRRLRSPLVVAGGINESNIALVKEHAEIIVVGSAITKSRHPGLVAKRLKELIRS
ncbi:MAG: orotidine 5'-phosphate decarboxylase / HUMPS family protein [Nitrososphaerota archaeon]